MTLLGCSKRQKYAKLELFSKSRIHDHTFQNAVKSSLASINISVHHETKLNRIYFYCGTSQRLYHASEYSGFSGVAYRIRHLSWDPFDLKAPANRLPELMSL